MNHSTFYRFRQYLIRIFYKNWFRSKAFPCPSMPQLQFSQIILLPHINCRNAKYNFSGRAREHQEASRDECC